jgi:hypothetical protein
MVQIVKQYSSINDYISDTVNNPEVLYPDRCGNCGSQTFCLNGFYERKSEGRGKEVEVKNGELKIRRLKCSGDSCGTNYSILPSLVPPLRWYLWCMQQFIISLFLSGTSISKIVAHCAMSRSTITRWIRWAEDNWKLFCAELMPKHTWMSKLSHFTGFYSSLFKRWKLSQVMAQLHQMGLAVP